MKSTALLTMTEGKLKIMMLIMFLSLSILRHQMLFADTAILYPSPADFNTGAVWNDYFSISSDYICASDLSGWISGGWARFDISSVPNGSTINSIRLYFTVFDIDPTYGAYVNIMQMSSDPSTINPLQPTSLQAVYNDISDGNVYYSNAWLSSNSTFYYNLSGSAVIDFQNQLSANWFAVGFKYNMATGYYAWIRGWNGPNPPYIVVDYTPSGGGGDSYEPDNSKTEAKYISTNSTASNHSINPMTDQDWKYFILTTPMDIDIETEGVTGGDTRMWLYDVSGTNVLMYNDNKGANNYSKITFPGLPIGTYYIKVDENGNNNTISDYSITLTATALPTGDIYEPDNSPAQVRKLALNSTELHHSIYPASDEDWIYFEPIGTMDVTIETDGIAGGDTKMWLYYPWLEVLDSSDDKAPGNLYSKITALGLDLMFYYVKINGKDKTLSDYSINILATSGVAPTTYVHGELKYTDRNGTPQPIRYAHVQIMDGNNPTGDRVLPNGDIFSRPDGSYYTTVTNDEADGLDIFVRVLAEGVPGACYGRPSYVTAIRDTLNALQNTKSNMYVNNTISDLPINWTVTLTDSSDGAFSIFDSIIEGFSQVWLKFGLSLDGITTYWPASATKFSVPLHSLRFVRGDRWDRDVILHEYGHYVQYFLNFAQGDIGDTRHRWNEDLRNWADGNPVTRTPQQARNMAFQEAWASFFSVALQSLSSVYHDLDDYNDMPPTKPDSIDLETETQLHSTPGQFFESMNCCALWDMFDANNATGIDNNDIISFGFGPAPADKLWCVTKYQRPMDDIVHYWAGWFARYNTNATEITRIFNDHQMSFVTLPLAQKWNLVSVPLIQSNSNVDVVFPGISGGVLYGFTEGGGYSVDITAELGFGYWAYYNTATTIAFSGTAPGSITVDGECGWNIIGSRSIPVPISSIVLSGGNWISGGVGYIFVPGRGYWPVTYISPGQGVWIWVRGPSSTCTITLP